jgi:hypothetical protein
MTRFRSWLIFMAAASSWAISTDVPPKRRTLRPNRGTSRPSLLAESATLLYREEATDPALGLVQVAFFPKPYVSTDRDEDENDLSPQESSL